MKKREVKLREEEKSWIFEQMQSGKLKTQAFRRAQILLALDEHSNEMKDAEIGNALGVGKQTVYGTRRLYIEEGVEKAVLRKVRSDKGTPLKVDGRVEAQLIAIACSEVPNELPKWTLRMLADKLVETGLITDISREKVRQVLKKHVKTTA